MARKTTSFSTYGRPPISITPAKIKQAEDLAAHGMPKSFIAKALGMSHDTLNDKEKKYPEFAEAIERGRAECLRRVTAGMMTNATTPTAWAPGGNLGAQVALYDRIVGRADTEIKMLVVPLFNEPTPRALLEHTDDEKA